MNKKWKNRIVGTGEEAPDQLLANPNNWRTHPQFQQEALKAVLDQVGWVQKVIVNKTTGHLIDGHLRVMLALRNNEKKIPVNYVKLTEPEELLILATFDPLAELAVMDHDVLTNLLNQVVTDNESVQHLLDDLKLKTGDYDFNNHSDTTGDDVDYNQGELIKIRIKQPTEVDNAIKAISRLINQHKEWLAEVEN